MKQPKLRFPEFTGDWKQHKFEDVVTIGSGKDYKHLESGNVPVYGTGGYMLSVNQALSESEDAVGIGRKGTIDKPYILRAPFWTVDTLFYCIPNEGFDLTFTNCLFQNVDWKKKDESTGVPSLSKVIINNVKTYVPSLEEQQKIAFLFTELDSLIQSAEKELEGYRELKQGMLQKMFPKKGEKVPEIRFPEFTGDWEQRKVFEIADRFDNLRVPVAANLRIPGNTPYYGANGIQDYVEGYTHDGEYILVAEDGASDLKNYPVNYVNGRIWVNNHAHVLQGKEKIANNKFLSYAMRLADIESVLVGGGRAKLNADIMMNLDIAIPSFNEQEQIGAYFSNLDNLITLHQREWKGKRLWIIINCLLNTIKNG